MTTDQLFWRCLRYALVGFALGFALASYGQTPTVTVDCANEAGWLVGCPVCWGDQDQSRDVTVDELTAVIARAVNGCHDRPDPFDPATVCWGDRNNNYQITRDEIAVVVDEMLNGCPP